MRWPVLFDTVDSTLQDWIVDQMHIVSPSFCVLARKRISVLHFLHLLKGYTCYNWFISISS